MASSYSTIGIPLRTDDEILDFAGRASAAGIRIETARGVYYRLTDGSGAELWAQLDRAGALVGLAPHFAGRTSCRVSVTAAISRENDSPLDGAFHAWALVDEEPDEDGEGMFPLVFDIPDGGARDALAMPSIQTVQLAAFAHECNFHPDEDAYLASQDDEMKFAAESFVPAGMFDSEDEPTAMALFSGHVVETSELINGWSGLPFCWARVHTLCGELDVVCDPEIVEGEPVAGGVVTGMFWLSGRLPDGAPPPARRSGWQRRLRRR